MDAHFLILNMKHILSYLLIIFTAVATFAAPSKNDEITWLREAADSLHSIGRTDSAVIVGERAIRLANESNDPTQIVGTHAALGVFLRSLGRIDDALNSYEKALAIVTSGKFRENPSQESIEEIASLYINLAVLNLDTQHKELAAKHAEMSGQWVSKSKDPELRSTVYGVIGSVLTGCGDLEKALHYQSLAYKDAIASGNKEAAFRSAAYTMLISDRLGDKAGAGQWREKCGVLLPEVESMMAKLVYYQAECSICLKNNNPEGAIKWFNVILGQEGIDNLPFVKFDCYNNLHLAYAETGDYKSAYTSLLKGNELRDSLWAQEKAESLRDLTVKYETKETELALAQSEAKRSNTLMWLFAVAGLLLIAIISQALKTLCMGTCTCIACVNWPLPLCHEPLDDPSEKAQKEPHGSFEVICSSSEHDIYRVSEKTLVEVPSQTMVALAVPDNWFYASPLPEQLVLPGFHVGGIRSFRYVRYHNLRVS